MFLEATVTLQQLVNKTIKLLLNYARTPSGVQLRQNIHLIFIKKEHLDYTLLFQISKKIHVLLCFSKFKAKFYGQNLFWDSNCA